MTKVNVGVIFMKLDNFKKAYDLVKNYNRSEGSKLVCKSIK